MINILLIGFNLIFLVYNQNLVVDNTVQALSLYRFKNEDQVLTIWVRFQIDIIAQYHLIGQIPFAIINILSQQGQIIFTYEYNKQLEMIMNIPQLEYQQNLYQIANYDQQTWISLQLFKNRQFEQLQIDNKTLKLPQIINDDRDFQGNLISWLNITFNLKAYIGKQESYYLEKYYLKSDPIIGLGRQIRMNYKNDFQIEMYFRKKSLRKITILIINDQQLFYYLIYGFSSVIINIQTNNKHETQQFEDIYHNQWFKYKLQIGNNKTISQINTFQNEYEWIYQNDFTSFISMIQFQYRFIETDNIIITNRIHDPQNLSNNCFPGCKKCIKMECLECELNLNLSNYCSCDQNQFYDQQTQICQDISQNEGYIQNQEQVQTCKLYEYFNDQKLKCMKCPRIDQYYCTDCVYNTELWRINKTCTFQEIYSNIFLNYIALDQKLQKNTYSVVFNQNYTQVSNQKCEFFQSNGFILCKLYDWEFLVKNICLYNSLLKKCLTVKGTQYKLESIIVCKQQYAQIKQKCSKCPLNCIICQYKLYKIKCLITKQGFYINLNNLIKQCVDESKQCVNTQQTQELKIEQEKNCQMRIGQDCLYCDQNFLTMIDLQCVQGEKISHQYNFEYSSNVQFYQLSVQQLFQISENQYKIMNKLTFSQILVYSRQYENIRLEQDLNNLNNDESCDKFIDFNNTQKCIQFKPNFTQIANNLNIHYCTSQTCTYKLILNIIIYISNVQVVMYKNNSYVNIQDFLNNYKNLLYLTEIILIAEVHVFDSFDQRCYNKDIILLDDEFKQKLFPQTIFKLALKFQSVSNYPNCQMQIFHSNFEYVEILNLETRNQLIIQLFSIDVKFFNCRFFSNQQIIIKAQNILFQNTSFFDQIANNTLIKIFHDNYIETLRFIQCLFYNISIGKGLIYINISSSVQNMLLKNVSIYQSMIVDSIFMEFIFIYLFRVETLDIFELDSSNSLIFCQIQLTNGFLNLNDLQIRNSSFTQSIFYQMDNDAEIKNVKIFNCYFNQSCLFDINHRVYITKAKFWSLIIHQSSLFIIRHLSYTMSFTYINIQDSQFYSNKNIISIVAYKTIMESILIANCTYSPPTNILDIKSDFGYIQFLTLINITNREQSKIIMQTVYLLNFEMQYIQVSQAHFFEIIVNQANLINILSEKADMNDIIFENFSLYEGQANEIIKLSLFDRRSVLLLEKLLIINFVVRQVLQSQLIHIYGSGGQQFISQIKIRNIVSTNQCQIFYFSKNFLKIYYVSAQFQQNVGFLNQFQSKIYINDYKQHGNSTAQQRPSRAPIFTNFRFKSIFESLVIFNSSFIQLKQPILQYELETRGIFTMKYAQIISLESIDNIFQSWNIKQDKHYSIFISLDKVLIKNISTQQKLSFLNCYNCYVLLNKIYFLNSDLQILDQYSGILVIVNTYIQNSKLKNNLNYFYLSLMNIIYVQNLQIRNQIGNSIIFNLDYYIAKILLQNIYCDSCQDLKHILQIKFRYPLKSVYNIQNLYITRTQFNSELIKVELIYNQSIIIRNLNIYYSILHQVVNNLQNQIMLKFEESSFINIIFTQQLIQDKVQYLNSYLSNCSYDGQNIAIINKSMVLNQHQKIFQQTISLSFKENYTFNQIQIKEKLHHVIFDQNQNLVYVPTGVPFSQFIFINPITWQYENPYENFIIILNQFTNELITCVLNQSINDQQGYFSNMNLFNLKNGLNIIENFTFLMNPYIKYTYIKNDIICNNITLRFNVRILPCQLGEFLYQNQCLICDITKNYYSVTHDKKIEKLQIGNIKIRSGFWRAQQDSNEIEKCNNEQCQGGWIPGDQSCSQGYAGALCLECDINDIKGQGNFAKYDDYCQICNYSLKIILKGIVISLWLMFLGFLSFNTNRQITHQYLIFRISKRNVADILMRQSTNQISIIFKIFTNYIFYLYMLKDKLDFLDYQVNFSLDLISNPTSQLQPQLDCFLNQYSQMGIHYLQLCFSLISPFYTLSLLFFIYFLLLKLKVIKFQFHLILITIYSVYLFNQQLIFQNQIQLLTYTTASNIKWINLNKQFQFHTKLHHLMMYNYVVPSTLLLFLIPGLIYAILRTVNKRSIKTTKYFGALFTEYRSDSYYWEIVRIYQKYLIIGSLFQFKNSFIFYLAQFYLALIFINQPYALKNLNLLEQKSYFILISIINILIYPEQSNQFRAVVFSILNLILIYDIIKNIIQKGIRQHRPMIIKILLIIIEKFPQVNKLIKIQKYNKLQHNLDILRNSFRKQKKLELIIPNIQKTITQFERLETEIEMINIKK